MTPTARGLLLAAVSAAADAGWQGSAACRGTDVTVFFGEGHREEPAERLAREAKAKAICRACPVQRECLSFAMRNRERFGVWGGTSESERARLFRMDAVMGR